MTKYVDIDIVKGKRRLAPFTSPHANATLVERRGWIRKTFEPPYIKMKMVCDAEDALKVSAGQHIYSGNISALDRSMQILTDDLQTLQEMEVRREEWMAAKVLETGKIVFTGDGVSKEIDFDMLETHIIASDDMETTWDSSDANPIKDLRTWYNLCGKDSGINPDTVVFGEDIAAAFLNHSKVQGLLDNRRYELGIINPAEQPDGAVYIGDLRDPFVALYRYNEYYTDPDTDITYPLVPANKLFMGSTRARNAAHYGAIQDVEATASVRWFPKSWIDKEQGARILSLQSAPVICMHQADAFLVAEPIAAA